MYEQWPFFAATIDLIEMILAKADMRIASLYDDVLVSDVQEKKLGVELRKKFEDTTTAVLEVGRVGGGACGCQGRLAVEVAIGPATRLQSPRDQESVGELAQGLLHVAAHTYHAPHDFSYGVSH
jgi:hypothetical protein